MDGKCIYDKLVIFVDREIDIIYEAKISNGFIGQLIEGCNIHEEGVIKRSDDVINGGT